MKKTLDAAIYSPVCAIKSLDSVRHAKRTTKQEAYLSVTKLSVLSTPDRVALSRFCEEDRKIDSGRSSYYFLLEQSATDSSEGENMLVIGVTTLDDFMSLK